MTATRIERDDWQDECGITSSSFLHQVGPGQTPVVVEARHGPHQRQRLPDRAAIGLDVV